MKNKIPLSSLLAIAALSAASVAFGQGAATSAPAPSPRADVPSAAPAAPAAQIQTPAATAPSAAVATPASTPSISPDTSVPTAPAASVAAPAAPAAANGDHILPAADRSTPVGSTLAGGLASSSTVAAIQRQEFDKRDQLLTEVTGRVQDADRQINELKQKSSGLDDEGKRSLTTAVADYEKAKAKLQQSLDTSRNSQANTWERARVSLATDYAFYVAAAAAVEVAAPNT